MLYENDSNPDVIVASNNSYEVGWTNLAQDIMLSTGTQRVWVRQ